MTEDSKVTKDHLGRTAVLYVRQSTLRQVMENRESTQRQYTLKTRARDLGWREDQIRVIDDDLGLSGASAGERKGFQDLVGDVSMGRVGLVMGLEVSRLARNNADWHRLLEICGLTRTLILDEDGLYDPGHFNDRLLLGLKGTMSEAELHFLRARLRGGILNKARRGELRMPLPVGYVYDENEKLMLDPDQRVQDAVTQLFAAFRRTRSARAVVQYFRENNLLFPGHGRGGSPGRDLVWSPLDHHRVLSILHNPRYAGAFVYGKTRSRIDPATGTVHTVQLPRDEWAVFLPDMHPAYLSWDEYLANQQALQTNAQAYGKDRRHGPPRSGPALLQGIVVCGKCGQRMVPRYLSRKNGALVPQYSCSREGIETGSRICQRVQGAAVDKLIGQVLLETMTPLTIELALEVLDEIRRRREEVVRVHQRHLEQARYDAEMARRRFLRVDPENRLVADNLERAWNQALACVQEAQEACDLFTKDGLAGLSDEEKARVRELARDFPVVWNDSRVSALDRKRMVRLVIEDVTLLKTDVIDVKIRFRGGAVNEVRLPVPLSLWEQRKASPELVDRLRELSKTKTAQETAAALNKECIKSPTGRAFTRTMVHSLRHRYGIPGLHRALKEKGFLTADEIAPRLGVSPATVKVWGRRGLLRTHRKDDRGMLLYEDPGEGRRPVKWKHGRPRVQPLTENTSDSSDVMQCET